MGEDPLEAHRRSHGLGQPAFISRVAEEQLAAWAEAAADRPLGALPFAVKDNIDVESLPTTAGCPTRTDPAREHAFAVQRLVDNGAVPIGKTNMDQFATGLVGTRSPFGACHCVDSPIHVSGGSSSGSAVAVAAGVVPLALGTDTAGSGRVPAAFNGVVGLKPSRGVVSTRGVFPASPSLDCVSIFSRSVALARTAFDAAAGYDERDVWSRAMPPQPPAEVARIMGVIAVPAGPLDLDAQHREAWDRALTRAAMVAEVVPVDVEPFLETARLLYGSALVAERLHSFGHLLEPDGPHLDPVVRSIVLGAAGFSAGDMFAAVERLTELRRAAAATFIAADALMLPVTPGHPTIAEVAANPVGVNARLGTYTNMVNLLDLCAIALPAGRRADGLPFGIQLMAPTFADHPLLDLAMRWADEESPAPQARVGHSLVAVAGAHMLGQPLNGGLQALGGRLFRRATTEHPYRMHLVPGPMPRPGLVADPGGRQMRVEVWEVPQSAVPTLVGSVSEPLAIGPMALSDGSRVPGFLASGSDLGPDITRFGGWREFLRSTDRDRLS